MNQIIMEIGSIGAVVVFIYIIMMFVNKPTKAESPPKVMKIYNERYAEERGFE